MIKVLFFAKLRDELGTAKLDCPAENVTTAAELRKFLIDSHSPQWGNSLVAENIIVAVNQEVVDWSHPVHSGDEVAFYPPVTGG